MKQVCGRILEEILPETREKIGSLKRSRPDGKGSRERGKKEAIARAIHMARREQANLTGFLTGFR